MNKLSFTVYILLGLVIDMPAQHYNVAAGVRMGTEFGLSIQARILKHTTIETMIHSSLNRNLSGATILVEQHQNILTDRLNFYGGVGPYQSFNSTTNKNLPGGLSMVLGAEVCLGRLNVSWDYKPTVVVWGESENKFRGETAVTLRYIFWKEPKKKINWKFWEKKNNKKKN